MVHGNFTCGKICLRSLRNTVLATLSAIFGLIAPKLLSNSDIAAVSFTATAAGAKFLTQAAKFWSMFSKILSISDLSNPPLYSFALRYLYKQQKLCF